MIVKKYTQICQNKDLCEEDLQDIYYNLKQIYISIKSKHVPHRTYEIPKISDISTNLIVEKLFILDFIDLLLSSSILGQKEVEILKKRKLEIQSKSKINIFKEYNEIRLVLNKLIE